MVKKGEHEIMKKKVKLIFILTSIIILLAMISYLAYCDIIKQNVSKNAAKFFSENKDIFDEFAEICLDNGITLIDTTNKEFSKKVYTYTIAKYTVFTLQELSDSVYNKLVKILELFEKNYVSHIWFSDSQEGEEADDRLITIIISRHSGWAEIIYTQKNIDTKEFVEYEFREQAQYLDKNWVLVYNINDKKITIEE